MIEKLVLLEQDIKDQTGRFLVAAFQDFVKFVVGRVREKICGTSFNLEGFLNCFFSRNWDAVVANGVQVVDALAGRQNLFDPR